jgi:hypothetical protein
VCLYVRLSVRPGADLGFRTSTDGQGGRAGRPGKKTWEIFQDMVFRTWDLMFGAWEILGYGFQDMVFKTWDLNFEAWEILGYGFQDMVSRTWDLNFGAWIFTLAGFQDRNLKSFRT